MQNVNNAIVDKKIDKPKKEKKEKFSWFYDPLAWFLKKTILKILYLPKIYGKENFITESRAIMICNHFSAKDPFPIIAQLFGKKSKALMKSELTNNTFVGRLLKSVGTISIRRGQSDLLAVKQIMNLLNNDGQLLIFPEGTRNKNGGKEMLPFKDGTANFAIKTHSPIVPMMYYKKTKFWHKNYLMIGKSFDLSEFYDKKTLDAKEQSTQKLLDKMYELREQLDIWVEKYGGNKKKYAKYVENCQKQQNIEIQQDTGIQQNLEKQAEKSTEK